MKSKVAFSPWLLVLAGMLLANVAAAEPDGNQAEPASAVSHGEDAVSAPTASPTTEANSVDSANKVEAERLRLLALSHYDAGDYGAALREFERANQLLPSSRLLYNLGVVSLALADPAGAYDYFDRCLSAGGPDLPQERRSELVIQLRDLSARTALLTVAVDTAGAVVVVDEQAVGIAPLAAPLRRNPGSVRVSVHLPGGRSVSRVANLTAGQMSRIDLKLIVPPPLVTQPEHAVPKQSVPWLGWAATAALTTGAVIAGLEALSAQHDYESAFQSITTRAELDQRDTRTTRWSVTADTLTGAAILTGVYSLYLTLRHAPATSSASHNSTHFSARLRAQQGELRIDF